MKDFFQNGTSQMHSVDSKPIEAKANQIFKLFEHEFDRLLSTKSLNIKSAVSKKSKGFVNFLSRVRGEIIRRIEEENSLNITNEHMTKFVSFPEEPTVHIEIKNMEREFNDLVKMLRENSDQNERELSSLFNEERENFGDFYINLKKQIYHKIKHHLNSKFNLNLKFEDNFELIKMDTCDLIESINDYIKNMMRKENLELLKHIEKIEFLFKNQMRELHAKAHDSSTSQLVLLEEVIYYEFLSIEHKINKNEIQLFYELNKVLRFYTRWLENMLVDLKNQLNKDIYLFLNKKN